MIQTHTVHRHTYKHTHCNTNSPQTHTVINTLAVIQTPTPTHSVPHILWYSHTYTVIHTHTLNHNHVTVHSTLPPTPPPNSPADGGRQEDEVGPQQVLHQRQRDGGRLIHAHQLCLAQLHAVTGMDVLQGVHTHTLLLGDVLQGVNTHTVTGWCTARGTHTHCYWVMYCKGYTHTLLLGGCTARGKHTHCYWVDVLQGVHTHCYWVDVLQGVHTHTLLLGGCTARG